VESMGGESVYGGYAVISVEAKMFEEPGNACWPFYVQPLSYVPFFTL